MANYNIKDVFYLDAVLTLGTDFDAGTQVSKAMDVSSYVNPISSGRTKGTGLAVYRVQFSWSDSSGNRPVAAAAAAAATDLSTNQLSASNDLMIAGIDYYSPASTGADKEIPSNSGFPFLEPSTDVPYVVVRDSIGLVAVDIINTTASMKMGVRLSCAIITLDQATLNQLLRTQTV